MINRTYHIVAKTLTNEFWLVHRHKSWFPEPLEVIKEFIKYSEEKHGKNILVTKFVRIK